jgi:hypothetical protein
MSASVYTHLISITAVLDSPAPPWTPAEENPTALLAAIDQRHARYTCLTSTACLRLRSLNTPVAEAVHALLDRPETAAPLRAYASLSPTDDLRQAYRDGRLIARAFARTHPFVRAWSTEHTVLPLSLDYDTFAALADHSLLWYGRVATLTLLFRRRTPEDALRDFQPFAGACP